jgi:SPOR domain
MNVADHANEKSVFFEVWHRVSAGLAAINAGLDRLPAQGRSELDRILRHLEIEQASLFDEVQNTPATTVAGIAFVERATDQLRVLEGRIRDLARFAAPPPVAASALTRPAPATAHQPGPAIGDRYGSVVDELHAALVRAEVARPTSAGYAPPQAHAGAPYPGTYQHPVQIVYVPHPMPPGAYARSGRGGDRDDGHDGQAKRSKGRSASDQRRHHDDTPIGMVSTLLKGMGGIVVLVSGAVMISNFSFADFFGGKRPELPQAAMHDTVDGWRGATRAVVEPSAPMAMPDSGDKVTARLEPRRITLPVAAQGERPNASTLVAPMARVKPAPQPGDLRPSDLEIGFQAPQQPRSTAKASAPAPAPVATAVTPPAVPAFKKPTIVAAVPAPPPPTAASAAEAAPEAPAEAPEASGGLYVAVLSTHKEAKTAREEFIELQKKHRDILGAKQSEVQLTAGASGSWHRLVVTPAVAKEDANEICSKLRSSGYGRCWVKPY